ncbi:YjjW family glycine radical enzyme activase [Parasedimentitalea psychrophila]|uniref:YjjW family glycine radical enzyme activase n=1 Tax=Parasedimentitalea psychrophila TaxID=2997337 RepID=A0A9Y2L090_9RHOB|nr:YjjW family glycine radical enzyme activase [Parasedimentitalea psychrophila]WIY24997.1 YjjW family glycine radical enzyme activase [Parasedimentitalea psychrophila]
MSSLQAQISKILTWSCVDGPGNRIVLFLQGCNFNCITCHNPHTIGRCNDCGDCIADCPTDALMLEGGKIRFDPALCTHCDACLAACSINANPMVQTYSVHDILTLLGKHKDFVSGITVSGGEATMQLPFTKALFTEMGRDPALAHLTRFIDTNGYLGAAAWTTVLDVTDGVMLDIKAFDCDTHRQLTGRDNARVLDSARMLHTAGKLYELRYLMVPSQTDTAGEIESLMAFTQSLEGPVRVRLNAFRTHGVRGEAAAWPAMEREQVEAAARALAEKSTGPVILPALW